MALFDESDPKTDLVIVSKSDGRKFYVYEAIICLASPLLKDSICSLDCSSSTEGQPVLSLDEPSAVLHSLLELCYPASTPPFEEAADMEPVLRAALKYAMGGIVERLREMLVGRFLYIAPIDVYACACSLRLQEEASRAEEELRRRFEQESANRPSNSKSKKSRVEWQYSMTYWKISKSGAMDDINAVDYIRLLQLPDDQKPEHSWTLAELPVTSVEPSQPFLPSTLGDVILRSADAVDFHVSKAIMSFTSPVFHDMFTLPQPEAACHDIPVVSVTEPSLTLSVLLRVCYPLNHELTENLNVVADALVAAMKYDMEVAVLRLRKTLLDEIGPKDPVGLYTRCCHLGLETEALAAAKLCLRHAVNPGDFRPWILVPAKYYKRLRDYRIVCGLHAAHDLQLPMRTGLPAWYTSDAKEWSKCTDECHNSTDRNSPVKTWWTEYTSQTAKLLQASPLAPTVTSFGRLLGVIPSPSTACSVCSPRVVQDIIHMRSFCEDLAKEVERKVDEIAF